MAVILYDQLIICIPVLASLLLWVLHASLWMVHVDSLLVPVYSGVRFVLVCARACLDANVLPRPLLSWQRPHPHLYVIKPFDGFNAKVRLMNV